MLVNSAAQDIVYTPLFTGVHGNYLKPSVLAAGLDPDNLPNADKSTMNFSSNGTAKAKAWRDIWGSGQGVGSICDIPSVADCVERPRGEYEKALVALEANATRAKSVAARGQSHGIVLPP